MLLEHENDQTAEATNAQKNSMNDPIKSLCFSEYFELYISVVVCGIFISGRFVMCMLLLVCWFKCIAKIPCHKDKTLAMHYAVQMMRKQFSNSGEQIYLLLFTDDARRFSVLDALFLSPF